MSLAEHGVLIRRERPTTSQSTSQIISTISINSSSTNGSSANRLFVSNSYTSRISINRSSANSSSANGSSANSSSANGSSANRRYAKSNSANSSSRNRKNKNYANSSSANRSSTNKSSTNGSSVNRSYVNSSSGNMESLNNTLCVTLSPHRRKLEKYIKHRELMLPQLSFSIIWECPTLQSLLMRDEYSKYMMTEDELNNLQWELEAMLTTINVRQKTITNELLTYHASMYINRRPKISSRVVKQISSINTFDHNIEDEFCSICYELHPRKIESAIFWSFVKPYLAYMSKHNFGWLIEMVEYYILNKKLFNIPPIGEHYSIKWVKKELEIFKMQEKLSSFMIDIMNKVNCFKYDENVYVAKYERIVINVAEDSQTSQDFVDKDKSQEISTVEEEFNSEQSVHYKSNKKLNKDLKTSLLKILHVKRPQNEPWTEEQKMAYIAKLDNRQLFSYDLSSSESNSSDNSSDDESNTTRVYVVTEPSEYNTNVKQNIKTEDQ